MTFYVEINFKKEMYHCYVHFMAEQENVLNVDKNSKVDTMRFWKNLHHGQNIGKQNNLSYLGANEPKG